jgi:hypothetical protein
MKNYVKRAQNNYNSKFDLITLRLPKGTKDRMRQLVGEDVVISDFCIRAILQELDVFEPAEAKPETFNSKPIYRDYDDITKTGKWWRKYAFFTDDKELDDLFIKMLDILDSSGKMDLDIDAYRQAVDLARFRDDPEEHYTTMQEDEENRKRQLEDLKVVLRQFCTDQDTTALFNYL